MKKNTLAILLLTAAAAYSQTKEEFAQITQNYDVNKIESFRQSMFQKQNAEHQAVQDYLAAHPGTRESYTAPDGTFYEIKWIRYDRPIYQATDNAGAARSTRTNTLHPGGELGLSLEGEGMIVGVWDEGYGLKNHVEFMDDASPAVTRLSFPDTPNPNPAGALHATHVIGTICAKGVDEAAMGMAPKSSVRSFNWTNDLTEATSQAGAGLLFSNQSYGVPIFNDEGTMQLTAAEPGRYDTEAQSWDTLANNSPYYLQVNSAGNEGSQSYTGGLMTGYDKLTYEKNAKNNLVVANANPTVNPITGAMTSNIINASSSQGPSDDGRIKPDIAGDGTNLYSASNATTTSYTTQTGTSMASPNVCGSLVLLQEYYHDLNDVYMRAATLKGLVCHTALDDNLKIGPDPKFGWGLLDCRKAAQAILANDNGTGMILEGTLTNGSTYTTTFNVTNPANLKATLSWNDPAGAAQTATNSSTPALVNDLDLRISDGTTTYFPWKLQLSNVSLAAIKGDNVVDNVESVPVTGTLTGSYTLTVSHKGTLTGSPQNFSLILTGTDLALNVKHSTVGSLSVWPNPATSQLHVSLLNASGAYQAQLADMQGRILLHRKVSSAELNDNAFSLEVSQFPRGVYVLSLSNDTGKFSTKVIKD